MLLALQADWNAAAQFALKEQKLYHIYAFGLTGRISPPNANNPGRVPWADCILPLRG